MSMSLSIRTVAEQDIKDIIQEPLKLEILRFGEIDDEETIEDLEEDEKEDLLNWKPSHTSEIFFIEGRFQSINYLLTEETEANQGSFPLNFLTSYRIPIGEVGWGPANFYTSNDVKEIAKALSNLNIDEVTKRYNEDIFNGYQIYPRGYKWQPNDYIDLIETILELTEFINKAASRNLGIYLLLM